MFSRTHRFLAFALFLPGALFAAGANVYLQHNLVSDVPGTADVTDPNLVNPWGLSFSATGPFWVSNQGKGNATVYNGSGAILPLVVAVPSGAAGGQPSGPTGQVQNSFGTSNPGAFVLANGRPASFIFSTQDGTISAWNSGSAAAMEVDNSAAGAVYKGLAIGSNSSGPLLYAPNFNTGNIDVYDGKFAPAKVSGGFSDPTLPAGFAPFNIWNLGGKLYVTYAKQDGAKKNDVGGAGNGFVDVFDTDGNLQKRLVSNGPLNSPWGVAIAPSTFGAFGGALLVGNFEDGKINAFDLSSGNSLGTLQDSNGNAIVIPGLWALLFGNGATGGDRNTLYFTAGINGQTHGLLGSLAPPAAVLSVVNGASGATGPIAPGEVLVLWGLTIGPSPGASGTVPSAGVLSPNLAGVSVTFNGNPAPILYTSASQTSVLAPYELGGFSSATVEVKYRGQTASLQVPVAFTAPGLFTLDFSGAGQAAALNADGSVNSSKNPASAGSIITLFATGQGSTNPPGQNGAVNDHIIREPQIPCTVTIDGKPAQVVYGGTAPDLVQGITQIEAIIPTGVTGTVPVVLTDGSSNSQSNVTISVK
ncbi:MAG TPA: TIGR03118 family protein [Bryobacteraceae bacterium]|nr:TIGR03118 family protein [Bryobacteraceae bacterium]